MKRFRKVPFFRFLFIGACFLFLCVFTTVALESPVLKSSWVEDIPCEWSGVSKIVAVGDLHGAYIHFVEILQGTHLVDDNLRWIGGKTHLVQIGDVLDRGDRPRDIFDLAIRLEKEAEEAGGKVHMLIGNHEEMNLANTAFDREEYITPSQFVQFLPENYRLSQEKKFKRRSRSSSSENSAPNDNYLEEWQEIIDKCMGKPRSRGRMEYFTYLNELYGDWIIGHNVIIKINNIVFVHGGISEVISQNWTLKELNDTYRVELNDLRQGFLQKNWKPEIEIYDRQLYNMPNGPLWDRTLAEREREGSAKSVGVILGNLYADHIVIAHTPQIGVGEEQMKKYGGRVWTIDTGIADYYRAFGGHVSALIINEGHFSIWPPDLEQKTTEKNLETQGVGNESKK